LILSSKVKVIIDWLLLPKVMEYTSEYRNDNDGIARFFTEKISSYEEDTEKIH
jgi:hypothetical protein